MSETWIDCVDDYGPGESTWIDRLPSHGLTLYYNDINSKKTNAISTQLLHTEEDRDWDEVLHLLLMFVQDPMLYIESMAQID